MPEMQCQHKLPTKSHDREGLVLSSATAESKLDIPLSHSTMYYRLVFIFFIKLLPSVFSFVTSLLELDDVKG